MANSADQLVEHPLELILARSLISILSLPALITDGDGRFFVRMESGLGEVEIGALPLAGPAGYQGAILVLWPVPSDGDA